MKRVEWKGVLLGVVVVVLTFWIIDFILHYAGVGESNFYYLSKFGNAILFALIWFLGFNYREHWKKLAYAIVFGTWISLYYLAFSYSGFVQLLGIDARYTPPPFVIFGVFLSSYLWWLVNIIAFYFGLEFSQLLKRKD